MFANQLSVDEFKALNPQFKRPVITGDEQTKILLPKENADKFHLNLAQWGMKMKSKIAFYFRRVMMSNVVSRLAKSSPTFIK